MCVGSCARGYVKEAEVVNWRTFRADLRETPWKCLSLSSGCPSPVRRHPLLPDSSAQQLQPVVLEQCEKPCSSLAARHCGRRKRRHQSYRYPIPSRSCLPRRLMASRESTSGRVLEGESTCHAVWRLPNAPYLRLTK